MRSMQSAILFYKFRPSVPSSIRLSVTLWYCIVKLFLPAGRVINLVFSSAIAVTKFQREHLNGGVKYMVWKIVCDYRLKSPFISEMVKDRAMVTMDDRKS